MFDATPIWFLIEPHLFAGFLLLMRLTGIVMFLPVLSGGGRTNLSVRIMLLCFMTVFMYSALGMPFVALPQSAIGSVPMIVHEFLVGASLGFFVRILFAIAEGAGLIAGTGMALGFGNVVDPLTGEQSPAISNFLSLGAMMLFVALGGHREVVLGLMTNLKLFPLGGDTPVGFDLETLKALGTGFFAASIKLAAPVLVVTSLINVGLGLLARAAPQVNIFAVGFALLLLGGIFVLDTTMLGLKELYEDRVETLSEDINHGMTGVYSNE